MQDFNFIRKQNQTIIDLVLFYVYSFGAFSASSCVLCTAPFTWSSVPEIKSKHRDYKESNISQIVLPILALHGNKAWIDSRQIPNVIPSSAI